MAIQSKYKFVLFCMLGINLFVLSCKSKVILDKEIQIPKQIWSQREIISFEWNVNDTTGTYNMELNIEHDVNFPFQNQYVLINTIFPDQVKKEQLLSLELFDTGGKPYGVCSSNTCSTNLLLQQKIKFPMIGTYQMQIKQFGRDTALQGVHQLHLRILSAQE